MRHTWLGAWTSAFVLTPCLNQLRMLAKWDCKLSGLNRTFISQCFLVCPRSFLVTKFVPREASLPGHQVHSYRGLSSWPSFHYVFS